MMIIMMTICVCSLCQSMDAKLKLLLEDNESYLHPSKEAATTQTGEAEPFDRYASSADILHFCQTASSKALTE